MKRIGILGGTFDPAHRVHMELARQALLQFELDVVLFIPTGNPVRKIGMTHASAEHRLNMLKAACDGEPGFEVSSLEVDRPSITYTIDTLLELKNYYGEASQFFLILGEDAALDLSTWKASDEIARLVTVLYAERPGCDTNLRIPEGFSCEKVHMPAQDISSTGIRKLLLEGADVSDYVPKETLVYIKEQGLYGQLQ
jgi:nicotinate-nucleotide adenylyltransferase